MQFKTHEIRFDPAVDAGAHWLDVMYRDHGLHCKLDPHASRGSRVVGWTLGPVGVTRAELTYAVDLEDALTGEDFLLRRTKLHLTLDAGERATIGGWFATSL